MASHILAQCVDCCRPPFSHKQQAALPTGLWQHFRTTFTLRISGFGGAFDQSLHSLKSNDSPISLAQEPRIYSACLRRICSAHSHCEPDHEILHPTSLSIFDVLSHTAKCEPTLVRAGFFIVSFEAPSIHSPSLNGTIPKPWNMAQDTLHNLLLYDPLVRGGEYLRRNAGNLYSQTTQSIKPGEPLELLENFSQLLILETTNDP